MAVNIDVLGTNLNQASSSTVTYTGITVGGSATCLVVQATWNGVPTGVSFTWDNTGTPQTMTVLQSTTTTDGTTCLTQLWGLLSPHTGLKTLAGSWTGNVSMAVNAVSFTGSAIDTLANCFQHAAGLQSASSSPALTLSGSTSGYTTAVIGAGTTTVNSITTTSSTGWASNTHATAAGAYAPGAASQTWTGSLGSATQSAMAAVDIMPPGSGSPPWTFELIDRGFVRQIPPKAFGGSPT